MTDSEASAPQDDSDEDIYKDFPEFNLEEELAKLEGSKESYKQEALDLSEKVKVLTEENRELKKLNEVLGKNISTLLKTAQTEVHRKDSLIEELRSKVDSFTFRRSNRFGKDKFTTTEDLEPVNYFKGECLECKKNRIKNRSKSKSCENRTSSESESRSYKSDGRKPDRYCSKEESKDCDNDKRLGHFRDNLKLNYKHSGSDHDAFIEKQRGSQFNRYSRRESIVGRRSYRQDDRHHSKFDSIDKRGYNKRDSNEDRFSLRGRDSDKHRNSRREGSPDKGRRSDARRNRSRSRNRTVERKENSSDRGRSRGPLESDSLTRSRQENRNKSKDSESSRNCNKSDESNKRTECSERSNSLVKVTDKSKQGAKDKDSVKNDGRRIVDDFETKSPLDALYNEMITTRSTTRVSNPKTGSTKTDSELEEGEYVEDKSEQPGSSDESEEWTVPSKNDKPMTLYSKRMMEKISAQQILEKGGESKQTGGSKGDYVNDEKVESQIEDANMKDSMETGREPGELTDDENVIESSKEFQEIAKVASSLDNRINRKPGTDDRRKIPEPERVLFKEPFKTGPNSNGISNNVVSETKETRDLIEFSPFKNNYKLIEISPLKPPSGEHILDVYNKRLPSNAQTQKEVESKIFNLIMSLSGTSSDTKTAEKTASERNEAQEVPANREEHKGETSENPETGKKMPCDEKTDEKKHESSSRRTNSRKSSKSKQTKGQEKPEKGQEKGRGKTSKTEEEVVDSVTPGETTQFLDFFLRTTSPSKPIVPAEQEREMEMRGKEENGGLGPTEKKSEANDNSTTAVNTSSEKESFNGSSGEIQGKDSQSKSKSPKLSSSKSKKATKSPLKKRNSNSNSKEESKGNEMGEGKRDKSTESKKKRKTSDAKADTKNGSSDETSRGRNKRKADTQNGDKQSREEKGQKRKRTVSERDEETKKQKLEDRKTCQKRSKRDSKSEPEERSEETVKEDITSFEFFKPITRMETGEKNGEEDANKSGGDYKMTTTMSLTGVVCLETPNKCVEKVMINEQAIYHFMDSKANTTYSPLPSSKYPEMTPRRMLKNDLTLTDSDDSTNKPNQDEEGAEEAEEEEEDEDDEEVEEEGEGVVVEEEGEGEMSENENSDSDSDSGASAFVDLL